MSKNINPILLSGGKVISKKEYEETLILNAIKNWKQNPERPRCPFYESGNPNATCRSSGVGQWISGSDDTRKFCGFRYTDCKRYMKRMGIKDTEQEYLREQYWKELFGENYQPASRKFLIKVLGGGEYGRGSRIRPKGVTGLWLCETR